MASAIILTVANGPLQGEQLARMFDWQPEVLKELELTWSTGPAGGLIAVVTLMVSSGAALAFLVKLPAIYFRDLPPAAPSADLHPVLRWLVWIGKNLLGVPAVIAGILLSLPGVPGPGISGFHVPLILGGYCYYLGRFCSISG